MVFLLFFTRPLAVPLPRQKVNIVKVRGFEGKRQRGGDKHIPLETFPSEGRKLWLLWCVLCAAVIA